MINEDTLVILKPDAIQRCLTGEIISRFEKKGLRITAIDMKQLNEIEAKNLYKSHSDKAWFEALIKFTISSPVILMVISGINSVEATRLVVNRIREDYAISKTSNNLVHSSDSPENAKREIDIFFSFSDKKIYTRNIDYWIYSPRDLVK